MEVLAIIPARCGSRSVPDKNIRNMAGRPMLAYSIEHGLKSELINRVIVSTDSEKYADIAREHGAEVPFIRPAEYATDTSLDYDVFKHALDYLRDNEGYEPDIVVQLRPTYPIRDVNDINEMIKILSEDEEADSVRAVAPAKEIPYKMWKKDENGVLTPFVTDIPECYNMPRQELPKVFYQNASIDVLRPRAIYESHSMTGKKTLGYVMKRNFDIDTEEDFLRAERYIELKRGGHRYVFDIDGVIAQYDPSLDYANVGPREKMVSAIRTLHEAGNEIVLFTARGYVTGIDWEETTKKQMEEFGVPYDELIFGKPNADFYIDDKMIDMDILEDYFS
ncbi:MAG: acylneuraminate cytidylyltransferase [Lachnospiraceae bacterium]|jgi:CMP-N-acetylneuraminic acid synthetase|nr:acylneuraminate cytidylyltransferase [Lachnospiraceae bacterium]